MGSPVVASFGIKSTKKLSFFSLYNMTQRGVVNQKSSQLLVAVKYFKFAPWTKGPVHDILMSSSNSVFVVQLDMQASRFAVMRQLLVFT